VTQTWNPGIERPVTAVLLAGGKGTRFWPASRSERPKQFLRPTGERTLLRATWDRFVRLVGKERILVVTGPSLVPMTRHELPELPPGNLVIEPSGRDTLPAAALGARSALERDADPVLVVAPTDHAILDEGAFGEALARALRAAGAGALVTFGVRPDRAAPEYGYIERAGDAEPDESAPVARFHEKPSPAQAAEYLAAGRFLWNAGIFAWRARVFFERMREADAPLADAVAALPPSARPDTPAWASFAEAWERIPRISIDRALMEKARGVRVVPLEAGWSDLGGWEALGALGEHDADGNVTAKDALYVHARDCAVHRHGGPGRGRVYALVGTENLIVVDTDDAVLICRRGAGESIRDVVLRLQAAGREDLL